MLAPADVTDFEAEACELDCRIDVHSSSCMQFMEDTFAIVAHRRLRNTVRGRCRLTGPAATQKAREAPDPRWSYHPKEEEARANCNICGRQSLDDSMDHAVRLRLRAGEFAHLDDCAPPAATLECSPVHTFGGCAAWADPDNSQHSLFGRKLAITCSRYFCSMHGDIHAIAW
jgi:hypothetical protein